MAYDYQKNKTDKALLYIKRKDLYAILEDRGVIGEITMEAIWVEIEKVQL